jgi:hypothetical protein
MMGSAQRIELLCYIYFRTKTKLMINKENNAGMPSKLVQAATLLNCIQEISSSNLDEDKGY